MDIRVHHIRVSDRGLLGDVVNTDLLSGVHEQVDNRLRPISTIPQQSEVRQRLLGTAELALFLAQFVRELDQQFAVAMALVLRKCEDTGNVVVVRGLLLLGEIADHMTPRGIPLALQRAAVVRPRTAEEGKTRNERTMT